MYRDYSMKSRVRHPKKLEQDVPRNWWHLLPGLHHGGQDCPLGLSYLLLASWKCPWVLLWWLSQPGRHSTQMRNAVGNAIAVGALNKNKMEGSGDKNNVSTAVMVAREDNPSIAAKPRALIFGLGIDHQIQGVFSLNLNEYSDESLCPGDIQQPILLGGQPAFNIFLHVGYKVDNPHQLMENWLYMLSHEKRQWGGGGRKEELDQARGISPMSLAPHCPSPIKSETLSPVLKQNAYNSHGSPEEILLFPRQIAFQNDAPCN